MIARDRDLLARLMTVNTQLGRLTVTLLDGQDGGELPAGGCHALGEALLALGQEMQARADELEGRVIEGARSSRDGAGVVLGRWASSGCWSSRGCSVTEPPTVPLPVWPHDAEPTERLPATGPIWPAQDLDEPDMTWRLRPPEREPAFLAGVARALRRL
ncbi:hypothetical protein B0I33_111226 [Prauserella shujinwangii]|uniref:Uncharacterized protein n=1 Tax=Prauserella shujinwangii TaxID=1453103 RepID=A0A2T0LNE3_9PSEU|nr:hypothetical protein [Prauserella shujinwangii]PRX44712.1 hypothetical protein B0I33_111226 [Prauserella shujinwangii]